MQESVEVAAKVAAEANWCPNALYYADKQAVLVAEANW